MTPTPVPTAAAPSVNPVLLKINSGIVATMPAVIAAVTAVEQLSADDVTGEEKHSVALQVLTGVGAGAAALGQTATNPNVQAISAMIQMAVMIAHLLGAFKHKKSAPVSAPVA